MLVLVAHSLKPPVSKVPERTLAGRARSRCTAKLCVAPGAKAGPATAHPDRTCHSRLLAVFAAAPPDVSSSKLTSCSSRKSRLGLAYSPSRCRTSRRHTRHSKGLSSSLELSPGGGSGAISACTNIFLIFFWCEESPLHSSGRNRLLNQYFVTGFSGRFVSNY